MWGGGVSGLSRGKIQMLSRTINLIKTLYFLTYPGPARSLIFWLAEKFLDSLPFKAKHFPSEAVASQHEVIRRKISSCQVGANQNNTNRP